MSARQLIQFSYILQLCLCLKNPGCIASLGMEDGAISDAQITASSQWDDNHSPSRARLNTRLTGNKKGGWSSRPCDLNQWLQVDLGSYKIVTRVATQGRNAHDQWVTSYRIEYSNDGVNFHFYQEPGDSSPKVFFTASALLQVSLVCCSTMILYRTRFVHGLFLRRTKLHTRILYEY